MVLHSNTYYAVPTASGSDAVTKKQLKFDSPSLAHRHCKKETLGNPRPDLTTLLQSYSCMVDESTIIVNAGTIPQKEYV